MNYPNIIVMWVNSNSFTNKLNCQLLSIKMIDSVYRKIIWSQWIIQINQQ